LTARRKTRLRPGAERSQGGPPEEGAEARRQTRPTQPRIPLVPDWVALERRARPAEAERSARRRRGGVQPPSPPPPTSAPFRWPLNRANNEPTEVAPP